jgi:hypothetical protein
MKKYLLKEFIKQVIKEEITKPTRVCSACDKTHYPMGSNVSHGICKRHFIETMSEMKVDKDEIKRMVDTYDKTTGWAPDLGEKGNPFTHS